MVSDRLTRNRSIELRDSEVKEYLFHTQHRNKTSNSFYYVYGTNGLNFIRI